MRELRKLASASKAEVPSGLESFFQGIAVKTTFKIDFVSHSLALKKNLNVKKRHLKYMGHLIRNDSLEKLILIRQTERKIYRIKQGLTYLASLSKIDGGIKFGRYQKQKNH